METLFARALFSNTAEHEDELTFSKDEIITVLERRVVGGGGWWLCSLCGRQGLAPANRLSLLSPAQAEELRANSRDLPDKHQNIYQTPKPVTELSADPIYEDINAIRGPPLPHTHSTDEHASHNDARDASTVQSRTGAELYDVPALVCSVASLAARGPIYNRPLPSISEGRQRPLFVHSTIPEPPAIRTIPKPSAIRTKPEPPAISTKPKPPAISTKPKPPAISNKPKPPAISIKPEPPNSEWIYDVPVCMQKQGVKSGHHGTLPLKTMNSNEQLYDVLPAPVRLQGKNTVTKPLSDVFKPICVAQASVDTESYTCKVSPRLRGTETSANSPLPRPSPKNDSERKSEPVQVIGQPRPMRDQLHQLPSRAIRGDDKDNKDNQRSSTVTTSTASSSSRSSCDSLLSSPESERLCEVSLSQEEACHRLCELQEDVCRSVSKLMLFVSSQWRSKEHLGQHLPQICTATEEVTDSITRFLSFALDVRRNTQRLTDLILQRRLLKQLSVVEEAGFILQQATDDLRELGWAMKTLAQDAGQSQTPDHLEKFVMVARTVPDDVKTLVSILNANGKLLFKSSSQEDDKRSSEKSLRNTESTVDSGIDDSDIQLQQTEEFDQQPKTAKGSFEPRKNDDIFMKQGPRGSSAPVQPSRKPSVSNYCRLYFGDIQTAIGMFVSSLSYGQPPEKFIFHSKQVILMGQRLVNMLCNEAKRMESGLEVLSVIDELCVHLKHLAMATKKAAVNFPEELSLQELRDAAGELEHRAHRSSLRLEVWMCPSQAQMRGNCV